MNFDKSNVFTLLAWNVDTFVLVSFKMFFALALSNGSHSTTQPQLLIELRAYVGQIGGYKINTYLSKYPSWEDLAKMFR